MTLDDEAIEAMQVVLQVVMPGAEVYSVVNELAETMELGVTVGILVSTTMSIEQVEDYDDRDWGDVLAQLVSAVRKSAGKLSATKSRLSKSELRRLGLDDDWKDKE